MSGVNLKILEPGEAGAFPDIAQENFEMYDASRAVIMGGGTAGGRSAIQLLAQTPDGKWVAIQVTARILDLIHSAWKGAKLRWKEPD